MCFEVNAISLQKKKKVNAIDGSLREELCTPPYQWLFKLHNKQKEDGRMVIYSSTKLMVREYGYWVSYLRILVICLR